MKVFYDKKHSEREFAVDDWVYLKLQHYKQQSVKQQGWNKLSPRYFGPFQISERVGKVAYRLKLPPIAKIHNVFHVSLLKRKVGEGVHTSPQLPPVIDPGNLKWEPIAVLDKRMFKKKGAAGTQWLIHWFGTIVDEATWEDS
ncbi:hypothetical protein ACLB2K_029751 [Fragaria x ananassa]